MLLLFAASSQAANFTRDAGDTHWSNLDQWNDNASGSYQDSTNFPTAGDTILLNGGRILTVDTNATVKTMVVPNGSTDAFLEVSVAGKTLSVGSLLVGINGHPGNGTVSQSDGSVSATTVKLRPAVDKTASYDFSGGMLTASSLNIGINTTNALGLSSFSQSGGTGSVSTASLGGAGGGTYRISGGRLDVSGVLNLNSNGCLTVVGGNASVSAGGFAAQTGAELAFELKQNGIRTVQAGGSVDLSDVSISIDGSVYGGVATNFVLLSADTLVSMPDATNITITGLADADVVQSGESVVISVVESQAVSLFENTVGDGLWGTAGNWSSGTVPSGAVHAVVGDGQVAMLSSNAPVVNAVTVGSNGTLVVQAGLTAAVFAVEGQGVLNLDLGMTAFEPVEITGSAYVDPAAQLIVDGSDYEGFDGYFSLIHSSGLPFTITNAALTGLDEREPSLVLEADGLWLRLVAPPALSERLCSLVPASRIVAEYSNTTFSASRTYEPSGSAWSVSFDEAHVLDTTLKQTAAHTNQSWELRIGIGGFIYSLRTGALGETVPPSYRSDGDTSPWNDEVWQGVAVGPLNDPGNGSHYFMHQSGVYLRDPVLEKPFYSPQVASYLDVENRSFTTVNWTPQAHINIYVDENPSNDWKSYLLCYTRYRDLGQGVIEVMMGYYNYGPDLLNWFNMPWGGVRRTSTEYGFTSEPGGTTWRAPITNSWGSVEDFNTTGGWQGYSATSNGVTPALGFVFGEDTNPLLPNQLSDSWFRTGYAGGTPTGNETDWRNYLVSTAVRRYNLPQGNGLWSRFYYVLGDDMQDLSDRIQSRGLIGADLAAFDYTEANTPLVAYRVSGSGGSFQCLENGSSPDFFLYAHPVSNSFPVFEVIEDDESRYLTWNPYANGIVKPYDGTMAGLRLLGFAMPSVGTNGTYAALDGLLPAENYLPDGESLHVRTANALETWRVDYFGFTEDAGDGANTANPDGDTAGNLYEYGLGGDPTNAADIGHRPAHATTTGGETHFVEYIYARRIGSESDLDYYLELATDLPSGNWTNSGYTELPVTEPIDAEFEAVTNRINTASQSNAFIRLNIKAL
jgi:hypothetical protein